MKESYAIGADIGGSHISAAAVNILNGELLDNSFIFTSLDNKAGSAEIIGKWGNTIQKVIERVGTKNIIGIGLAMPGPFDYINGIALFKGDTKKYENIYGLNVSIALKKYLSLPDSFPFRFINDATAFAVGEEWKGKTSGTKLSLAITLGTGIGSGFIENGLPVFTSKNVPENGFLYNLTFKDGIADDYFSTRGLIRAYEGIKRQKIAGVKEIAIAAKTEIEVHQLMQNFGKELAQFLLPWLKKFNAETVVIGGNISKAFSLFGETMQEEIYNHGLKATIEKSDLNDIAQIIGAARIINENYWKKVYPRLKS